MSDENNLVLLQDFFDRDKRDLYQLLQNCTNVNKSLGHEV
jgi:hypothetical protein